MLNLSALKTADLVALYNALAPAAPVKKFQDRTTAERRVAAVATPAALLKAHRCPLCAGHPSSQTAAGKDGDACGLCHECGGTYHRSTGAPAARAPASASRAAGIAASWDRPEVRSARSARHPVVVNGTETFRSVAAAFRALKLPLKVHVSFRGHLVEKGFGAIDGYQFALVVR